MTNALDVIAERHDASPGQVALAWLLKRSPIMLPIPGTSQVSHLEDNMQSVAILLDVDEFEELSLRGKKGCRPAR